jgi:hypothetical protein
MINWLRAFFGKKQIPSKVFSRWSKEELASKKQYLETKNPAEFMPDDWMMVVDYLVQKYLPQDVMMDDAKWQEKRSAMAEQMRNKMPEMAAVAIAAKTKNTRTPMPEPIKYSLTREDFDLDILPNLTRFSFVPDPQDLDWGGRPLANSFFLLSSPDYPDIRAAKDWIMGKCDDFAVMHVARALRQNYETLRTAEIAGYKSVRVMSSSRHTCQECKKLDRSELLIADLLTAYGNATVAFPHEMPPYNEDDDTAQWCADVRLSALGQPSNHNLNYDPKLAAWIDEHFKKKAPL